MVDIYKVTGAAIGKTKRGFEIYEIQLNNTMVATMLLPLREIDKKYSKLYRLYIENNKSMDFLVGKYISISLCQTQYGLEFSSIEHFDAIRDFQKLLNSSDGKAFCTSMNMYEFLRRKNYPVNKDGSITLKKPYDNFNINSKNVCYPNNLGDNHLSLDNIEIVFEGFYKNKIIDNGNPDRDEKYVLKSVSIGIDRHIYHKSKSKTISSDYFAVLQIGDLLTEEQHSFVLSKRGGHVET